MKTTFRLKSLSLLESNQH